jgi:calmodulin
MSNYVFYFFFLYFLDSVQKPDRNTENELMEAFRVFDKDDIGMIRENDIRVIFTSLGDTVTVEEINSLLSQVTIDEAGRVKYADFIKVMMKGSM